jgi:hypothetical protein
VDWRLLGLMCISGKYFSPGGRYLRRKTNTTTKIRSKRPMLPGQMKNPPLLETPATIHPVSGKAPIARQVSNRAHLANFGGHPFCVLTIFIYLLTAKQPAIQRAVRKNCSEALKYSTIAR